MVTDTIEPKPVVWRVKCYADEWIYIIDKFRAHRVSKYFHNATIEPLYSSSTIISLIKQVDALTHECQTSMATIASERDRAEGK